MRSEGSSRAGSRHRHSFFDGVIRIERAACSADRGRGHEERQRAGEPSSCRAGRFKTDFAWTSLGTEQAHLMQRHSNYIGGKWTPSSGGDYFSRSNPAHPSQSLGEFPSSTPGDVNAAVAAAESASCAWAETPGPQRGAILFRFAQLLEE